MRRCATLLTVILVLCCAAIVASAGDHYVDVNTGDDANSGLSPEGAWKTITHATRVACGEDYNVLSSTILTEPFVVYVAPGIYSLETGESVDDMGWYLKQVHFIGSGRDEVILDMMGERCSVFSLAWNCLLSGFTITGAGSAICDCSYTWVVDCTFRGNNSGAFIDSSYRAVFYSCIFENNTLYAIYAGTEYVHSMSIIGCMIRGNDQGVCISGGTEDMPSVVMDTVFSGNRQYGLGVGLYDETYCTIRNCLLTENGNGVPHGQFEKTFGGLLICYVGSDGPSRAGISVQSCTFVRNASGNTSGVEYWPLYLSMYGENILPQEPAVITDCVLRDGGDEIGEEVPGMVAVYNSCVEDGWDGLGEGNFDADPLFVTGPLGDYYLSQTAAGQAEDSPCVDAGSTSAYSAAIADKTTRTDGRPDTGVVDIGYHYPTLFMLPEVSVSTPSAAYSHGEALEVVFEAINLNPYSYPVDLYTAILTPAGDLWTIGFDGTWSSALSPWFASLELPPSFTFGPTTLLSIELPSDAPPISDPGPHLVAAAFSHVGTTAFIGEPSLSAFNLTGD